MNKSLLAVGLIIISGVAFFMWINPHYANVKLLKMELAESETALAKAQELDAKRLSLIEIENSFDPDDVAKLQKMLPDHIDGIRFIVDMQGIASRHGLAIKDINLADAAQKTGTPARSIGPSANQTGETTLSFSVSTSYENLIAFLEDVEKSLRIVEIKSLAFSVDPTRSNFYKVSLTVNAFWLNQPKANDAAPAPVTEP